MKLHTPTCACTFTLKAFSLCGHHGGARLLPGCGSHIFLRGDECVQGGPGGAGRPGVHERVLSVCVGSAAVSGAGSVHWHGHVPHHSSGVLQLPALEGGKTACGGKETKEEDKVRRGNKRWFQTGC